MHVERKSELRNLLSIGDKRVKLVEPRNIKSRVWRFFSLVAYENAVEPYACCKTCGDLLSYTGKTGTGSLLRHKCLHNGKSTRITKVKAIREPIRFAKPKILESQSSEPGALPSKWEQYEEGDEIVDEIKDMIYNEDPLCYSPIDDVVEEHQPADKVTVVNSAKLSPQSTSTAVVIAQSSPATSKIPKSSLDTSIDRLTTVSEQLSYLLQQNQDDQNKDDDYYFALSLVPIMRQLSLNRKLYVRSKIQEILFRETETELLKSE